MLLLMIALGALYALLQSYGMMESVSYSFLMLPDPVRAFFGFVSALDLSVTGTIRITLAGSVTAYASRRYVRKIKAVLGL